jgi:hypothetical protein
MADWVVEPPTPADVERWRLLYEAYANFYEFAPSVWGWIQDPTHEVRALVVLDSREGTPVGLALPPSRGRYRQAPAASSMTCSSSSDASAFRMTADNNYRARGKYDKVAARTTWDQIRHVFRRDVGAAFSHPMGGMC